MSERLQEIDVLKGLAIILVVYGHMEVAANIPAEGAWYLNSKDFVYYFHMPLFMLLAGLTFGLSKSRPKDLSNGLKWLGRQADRTLVPFLVMAILVLVAKDVASHFVHVANYEGGLAENVANFFFFDSSPVRFLWFLPVLFVFYLITFFLHLRLSFFQVFLVSAAIYVGGIFIDFKSHWSSFLYFNQIVSNYMYFCIGILIAARPREVLATAARLLPAFVVAAIILMAFPDIQKASGNGLINRFIVSAVMISTIFGLASFLGPVSKPLDFLGRHTLIIYLLNVPVIAVTLMAWNRTIGLSGIGLPLGIAVAFFVGLLLPIAIKLGILARSKIVLRYVN